MRSTRSDASRPLGPPGAEWAGPSRRARAIAAALAVLLAALTAVVLSLAWKRVAPPASSRGAVEVKLLASPAPAVIHAPGQAAPSAAR